MSFEYETFTPRAGVTLAYRRFVPEQSVPGLPGVVFLSGFKSDMTGTKAQFLEESCRRRNQPFVRFDYQGHGHSSGKFEEGTIGLWKEDALAVIDKLTQGPLILVGSSMGGWLMLLCALARPTRVCGLIGIAAAPDFTEDLFWNVLAQKQRNALMKRGHISAPSKYGEPYIFTRALIEDGRNHLLLREEIKIDAPVRLLQGREDPDVPWETAGMIAKKLTGEDVETIYIEDGDHRLSREEDLALLDETLQSLTGQILGGYSLL